jgi:hypothetical protein
MGAGQPSVVTLLNSVTTTGAGASYTMWNEEKSFHIIHSTAAGVGAAEVVVQVSNDNSNWADAATFTLTLSTTPTSEAFCRNGTWKYVRGKVNSISGTGASVTLIASNLTR